MEEITMNFKKIIASVAAAAVAVSTMAVSSFALGTDDYTVIDGANATLYINADKPEDPAWAVDANVDQTTIYGVTFHVTFGSEEWYGGGIGVCANSTGWVYTEWGTNSKPITADVENGTITLLQSTPVFAADDAYAQLFIQTWSGSDTLTVNYADILGEGGTVIATAEKTSASAETETEEATPAADEAKDETPTNDAEPETVEETSNEPAAISEDAAPATTEDATSSDADTSSTDTETTSTPDSDSTTTAAKTGNTAAAVAVSVMAVAAAAAVVSKRK
jgi:hypothetical protein